MSDGRVQPARTRPRSHRDPPAVPLADTFAVAEHATAEHAHTPPTARWTTNRSDPPCTGRKASPTARTATPTGTRTGPGCTTPAATSDPSAAHAARQHPTHRLLLETERPTHGRPEDLRALEQFRIVHDGSATRFVVPEDPGTATAYAYTAGLTGHALPEFVVAGLRSAFAYPLINHLAARVHRDDERFTNYQHLGVLVDAEAATASPLLRHVTDRYPPGEAAPPTAAPWHRPPRSPASPKSAATPSPPPNRETIMSDNNRPPTDLTHLHPDHVRVGHAGIFALDANYTPDAAGRMRWPVGFLGVLIDVWNGWAVFHCAQDVADAIITDQRRARDDERARLAAEGLTGDTLAAAVNEVMADMYWDGDDVVTDNCGRHGEPDAFQRCGPDEHGRYVINGWDWTWTAVDPADCDRIAGTPPAAGDHVAFVPLRHTDMTVPHGRLQVTDLHIRKTRNGTVFVATLCRDHVAVATIEHCGGGPTRLHPGHASFTAEDMDAYVRACRLRGHTPTREQVLNALITEYHTTRHVEAALNRRGTLVRLRDDHGDTVAELTVIPSPRGWAEKQNLAAQLTTEHPEPRGTAWQIWQHHGWAHLTATTPTT
jgi:Domain of unknown function (DUF4262)